MYKKYLNDVVTFVTPLGEIVGRLKKVEEDYVEITSPRLFVHGSDGAGFAPGITVTGNQNPDKCFLPKSSILVIVEPHQDIVNGWQGQTSGIVLQGA